jgi:P-type Mg2+ transporter
MQPSYEPFWTLSLEMLFQHFSSRKEGLNDQEVEDRLAKFGPNLLKKKKKPNNFLLFLRQFNSPLILLLLACAILAFFLSDLTDALIIFSIVFLSALLGWIQEKGALNAIEKLLSLVEIKCTVIRNGEKVDITSDQIVPGDLLVLNAGDIIPADCAVLEAKHLFINESTFTGESAGVEKFTGTLPEKTPLRERNNTLFMGTFVISGNGLALVTATGKKTEFGKLSEHVKALPTKTAFESGVQRFGYLLVQITFTFVTAIFAINVLFHRPIFESLFFSLALGVGFTPQLLPAIVTINLCRGAKFLAKKSVIVKKLASIENFGSMDILCADKTGTLTEGSLDLTAFCGISGKASEKTLLYGGVNAFLQAGFTNPLDTAILKKSKEHTHYKKLDELPYDFERKRITVLAASPSESVLITKGAFAPILALCSTVETENGQVVDIAPFKPALEKLLTESSQSGYRLLAVAYRRHDKPSFTLEDEKNLTFLGYLQFSDQLKVGIRESIDHLQKLGVTLKIISGDHHLVVTHIAEKIGLKQNHLLTGTELDEMSDEVLLKEIEKRNLFAEIEPVQKVRLILALRRAGHIVGYLGDGINDSGALKAADVGISVDNATDIAKESADFILLKKDLNILKGGVQEGRRIFANTLKYIFMATSANFGNMFSMAGASLFLTFLPLLPRQILLINFLTDIPEVTISTDRVDAEFLKKPKTWDLKFIRRFMIVFGLVSSIFDYLTFGVLLFLSSSVEIFRTGWFVESIISAATIVLVIRTRKPIFSSRPSKYLLGAVIAIVIFTLMLPYSVIGTLFQLGPLSPLLLGLIGIIVLLYIVTAELIKKIFYNHVKI